MHMRIYNKLVAHIFSMQRTDISKALEMWAPLDSAEDFDNVGWLYQSSNPDINGVLICHDALENVIEEAYQKNCEMIVCYHPILFNGLKRFDQTNYVARAIQKAISYNISIYAMHTALDKVIGGVSDLMAENLGLTKVSFLLPDSKESGMGRIGYFKKPLDSKTFLERIQKTFKTPVIRHSNFTKNAIHKVAVLGGSGAFAIEEAIRQNADAYVTGDLKYHDFFKPQGQLLLADVGHFESERFTKNAIAKYLQEKFSNFAVNLSEINTNPVGYYPYGEE